MRFELYTSKTVNECMSALNERIQYKGSATRPALDGWIEKGGKFSLALTSTVARRFSRTTRMRGTVAEEEGLTIIRGSMPDGVDRQGLTMVIAAIAIAAAGILLNGRPVLSIVAVAIGGAICVALIGDHHNSEILMKDLQKTLQAKTTPPRRR